MKQICHILFRYDDIRNLLRITRLYFENTIYARVLLQTQIGHILFRYDEAPDIL